MWKEIENGKETIYQIEWGENGEDGFYLQVVKRKEGSGWALYRGSDSLIHSDSIEDTKNEEELKRRSLAAASDWANKLHMDIRGIYRKSLVDSMIGYAKEESVKRMIET